MLGYYSLLIYIFQPLICLYFHGQFSIYSLQRNLRRLHLPFYTSTVECVYASFEHNYQAPKNNFLLCVNVHMLKRLAHETILLISFRLQPVYFVIMKCKKIFLHIYMKNKNTKYTLIHLYTSAALSLISST